MIEAARERLARFGDRVEYVVADLGQPLPIDGPVDAILSTATFHWVPDHDALFPNLAAVLRPGGCWSRSAAASATSPRSSGSWPRSATAGSARPTSRRRWRPSAGSTPLASSTSSAG